MKRFFLFIAILIMVISCSKESFDKKEGRLSRSYIELESTIIKVPNLDSITRMNAGKFLECNLTKREIDSITDIAENSSRVLSGYSISTVAEGPEYTDWSGKIHLKYFTESNYPYKRNWPSIRVSVPSDWVVVGGGAKAWGYAHDGGFLTESRPNATLTSWTGSSKDHINPDPHYITVYAIGMKIDSVTPSFLRSKLRIYNQTSPIANHPAIYASLPSNYLRLGGGVIVNWTGYGNLLTISEPYSTNSWFVKSKDHRRPSPCTITAYIIGIENISFPNVGYVQVDTTMQLEIAYPPGEAWICTTTKPSYALTGVGGHAHFTESGRMLVKMYPIWDNPYEEDAQIHALWHTYWDYGWTSASAVMIRAAM